MEKKSEESSKNEFVFDTSAFLSLEGVNLLLRILELSSVLTTQKVIKEVEEFAQYEDVLGNIAKCVLKKKSQFQIVNVIVKYKLNFVSDVDEELFNLALIKNLFLITDNLKLLRHSKGKIKVAFSTFFLFTFINIGMLTKDDAISKLEAMRNIRNWQDNIIYISTKDAINNL